VPKQTKKRRLNARDLLNFTMVDDPQISPDGKQVAWVKTVVDAKNDGYQANLFITDIATGKTKQLANGTHPHWSPDGRFIAYLAAGKKMQEKEVATAESFWGKLPQLHVISAKGGKARTLTDLAGGVMNPSWSPNSKELVFLTLVNPERGLEAVASTSDENLYEYFNRDVLVVNRVNWKSDSLGLLGNYFSHIAKVAFNATSKTMPKPVLLTEGRSDFAAPRFSPDGKQLAVVGNIHPDADRQRKKFIYVLDAKAKKPTKLKKLFELAEMRSNDLAWSPDGKKIAVCGHNEAAKGHYGLQELWIVSVPSGKAECVTKHLDVSLGDYSRNQDMRRYGGDDGPRWSADSKSLLVLVNEAGTVHLASFSLQTKELERLTSGDKVIFAFSPDAKHERTVVLITDNTNPCDLFMLEHQSKSLRQLTNVNEDLLNEIELTAPEKFQSHSSGVEVDGWVYPPLGLKPNKKSPVILYTGGGPGGMRASVFCFEWQLYAALGYTVINCNARGNYGYGEAFSLATRGKWGDLDYEDNMAFLHDALEHYNYMDAKRLAVAGGSYGGYMATWIISRHQNFNAAVVDRCLYNRYSFNGTGDIGHLLDQIEFDKKLPWEATEQYLERSPAHYIQGAKTPTLVVHSEQDHRCPIDQGEQLYMSLKHLGVPTELVRFPNETHELSRSGRPWHRIFRLDRYQNWFERYL
jgi:dipeptidyl aminopeptidase/acylaminoacyl peptidase